MKIFKLSQTYQNIVDPMYLTKMVKSFHHNLADFEEGDLIDRIHNYSYWKLVDYDISKLQLDEWYVEEEYVEDYVEETKNNPNYPPVIIDDKSSNIPTIVDGTHRLNALNELGHTTVKAYVPYKK